MANDGKWGWAGGGANGQTQLQIAMMEEQARLNGGNLQRTRMVVRDASAPPSTMPRRDTEFPTCPPTWPQPQPDPSLGRPSGFPWIWKPSSEKPLVGLPLLPGAKGDLKSNPYMWWKLGISTAARLTVRYDAWPTNNRAGVSGLLGTLKITWLAGPLDKTGGVLKLYNTIVSPPSRTSPDPSGNDVAEVKPLNFSQSNGMAGSKPGFVTSILAPQDPNLAVINLPGVIAAAGLILTPFGNQGVTQDEDTGQIGQVALPSKTEDSYLWTLDGAKTGTDRGNQIQYSLQRTYFEVWGGFYLNPL